MKESKEKNKRRKKKEWIPNHYKCFEEKSEREGRVGVQSGLSTVSNNVIREGFTYWENNI